MRKFYLVDTLGESDDESRAFIEDYVKGLEMDDYATGAGQPAAPKWPKDAAIYLRKGTGRKLGELLGTVTNNLIVSTKFRQIIERHTKGVEIEYLPFALYDVRKRLLSSDYVIVNPIGTFDCLDLESSEIHRSKKDPNKILSVETPVLSAKKVEKAPALFRIRENPMAYVISIEIAQEVADQDLDNVVWEKLEVR